MPGALSVRKIQVFRYTPDLLPAERSGSYGARETCVTQESRKSMASRSIPSDDHLYVALRGNGVKEYNASCVFAETVLSGVCAGDVDVWRRGADFAIYVSMHEGSLGDPTVSTYNGNAPHGLKKTIHAVAGFEGRTKTACSSSPSTR